MFVAEADESDGSFLLLRPEVGVVTNVEEDHLDFYRGGLDEIVSAFAAFLERCTLCGGLRRRPRRAGGARDRRARRPTRVVRYGLGADNDVRLAPGTRRALAARGNAVADAGAADVELALQVPGVHNLLNAAAAVLAAGFVGVSIEAAARDVGGVLGGAPPVRTARRGAGGDVRRRLRASPDRARATLEAARRTGPRRIVAVFQPHRYTRTQRLWRELGQSLSTADLVVITDVYGAGEEPIPGVSGQLVVDALAEASPGTRIVYVRRRSELAPFLADEVGPGDLVLTLGAGDVTMVADETLERMRGAE